MLEYMNLMLHDKDFFMDNFAGLVVSALLLSFLALLICESIKLHKDMRDDDEEVDE